METAATASSSAATTPPGGAPPILKTLQEFEQEHQLDPNLPLEEVNAVEAVLEAADTEKAKELETNLGENSPYPEVRPDPPIFRPAFRSDSLTLEETGARSRQERGCRRPREHDPRLGDRHGSLHSRLFRQHAVLSAQPERVHQYVRDPADCLPHWPGLGPDLPR